jgi:hypothetical protein
MFVQNNGRRMKMGSFVSSVLIVDISLLFILSWQWDINRRSRRAGHLSG